MKMRLLSLIFALSIITFSGFAQRFEVKPVKYNDIEGAITFKQPQIVVDNKDNPIYVEKTGHASPILYDWDKDGKDDLLIGEFGGGNSANLVIHLNIGKKKKPVFSSEGVYALDANGDKLYIMGS